MSIVISDDVTLTAEEEEAGVNANNPRIGWHTVLTASNVTSDEAESGYPVTRVASPLTFQRWKGTTNAVQHIVVDCSSATTVNYFAFAGHNFGTDGTNVKLQKSTDGSSWTDVTTNRVPSNDFAYMEEFEDQSVRYYRLRMDPSTLVPEIAVLYIGRVLRMQRRLFVGHKPVTLNRKTEVSSGFSENGQFLGRVKIRQALKGQADFKNIDQDWMRETFDPFVVAAEESPWFFAWRPDDWPDEVGFMWLDGDPEETNDLPNGLMSLSFSMNGMR